MYIGDYLARRELYSPDKLAFIDAGKSPEWRLTFRDANRRANKLANWLKSQGVEKGDRVAILARDGYEHLDLFFACSKLGAIHTALNWRSHWRELLEIFNYTNPKILIFSDDFKEGVSQLTAHYPLPTIHLDGNGIDGSLPFESTLQSAPDSAVTCPSLEAEDTAALIFTGGTTGLPKAAEVSHRMIAWNTLNTVIHDVTHNDVYLNVFPMFHTGGLFVYTLPQVIFGGTTILIRAFDPAQVLNLLEREKVTIFAAVPTMYQMLTTAPNWDSVNLSALRFCTSGGAPLPVPLVEKYTAEKNIRFKQGFGMTEFGPGIFALAPEDAIRKAGSIGRPNFFVDAQIVDEQNQFLGPNEAGELVLKGQSYSSGYFNNPEATKAAVDERGYFHTGDVAQYDDEGYFYIVDRKKDMFISGGENVYPAEIEKALYQHPAVHMCAVIGLPDAKWGEVGKACVVLKPNQSTTEEELLKFMTERLAKYKVPKSVSFMEALPISAAGKILKRELREQWIVNSE
ncbi:long-chain fatty acid--CoA ligase [Candidatus Villigracilis saccharophilus]|uniref:class I adenylate-forming enzyme family protein n=1 Tax=Candidatus Villigracilis saccharophilus TaxID=3140684 RepID=UPI00313712AA|nr:long-chain fatty acid--CoA ligase [Anaerolineales bacterium]